MNVFHSIDRFLKYGHQPPRIHVNVIRDTLVRYISAERRGGPIKYKGVEIVPLKKRKPRKPA